MSSPRSESGSEVPEEEVIDELAQLPVDEEDEGEDLGETMAEDYKAIPALDVYETEGIDTGTSKSA